MDELTAFQRDLLYIIGGMKSPKGLAIKEELERYYPSSITHGRLYSNINKLVEEGLIRKESKDGRTNQYSLTSVARLKIEARFQWEKQYLDGSIHDN